MRSAITTFEIERSQYCKWYVPRTPNSSFYFPKASCNCWKRFSAYTFPRFIFNLRTLSYHSLSLDSERLHCSNGYVIRIRCNCKHWTWRGCISLCLVVCSVETIAASAAYRGGSTGRRPVRKKRPAKRVFFFWFPLRSRCFIRKWVNPTFPDWKSISSIFALSSKLYVDRRRSPGLVFFGRS